MTDMERTNDIPDELFELLGKKMFHELSNREKEWVSDWFTEAEFNAAAQFAVQSDAVFRADEELFIPDPAIEKTLSKRFRKKHRQPIFMRTIPIWQAAALLLFLLGLSRFSLTDEGSMQHATHDTVYITKVIPETITDRDTVYIAQQTAKHSNQMHITTVSHRPQLPPPTTKTTIQLVDIADVYSLHTLEISEINEPQNLVSTNSMAEDPLMQSFGFRRF